MRIESVASGGRFFLVVLLASVAITTPLGCFRPDEGFHNKGGTLADGTTYDGLWRKGDLEYIVFSPAKARLKAGPLYSHSSQWRGSTPLSRGVSLLPEGLYVDGALVKTDGLRKAFVIQVDGSLRVVKIGQDDIESLSLSGMESLEKSDLWPLLRAEFDLR